MHTSAACNPGFTISKDCCDGNIMSACCTHATTHTTHQHTQHSASDITTHMRVCVLIYVIDLACRGRSRSAVPSEVPPSNPHHGMEPASANVEQSPLGRSPSNRAYSSANHLLNFHSHHDRSHPFSVYAFWTHTCQVASLSSVYMSACKAEHEDHAWLAAVFLPEPEIKTVCRGSCSTFQADI